MRFQAQRTYPGADRPKKNVWLAVDVMVRVMPDEPQQAPIIMVSRRAWSPGIYWALRLLGKTLDVAWDRACICSLTFKNLSLIAMLYLGTYPVSMAGGRRTGCYNINS
jgi:hypothetical protein